MKSLLVLLLCNVPLVAHDPVTTRLTWTREVSRIVASHCLTCHGEGSSVLPVLSSYVEARPWAKAIKEQVLTRQMPPWGAVKGFGEFAADPSLSQEEIAIIADWVEGGAPEGDPRLLPTAMPSPLAPHAPVAHSQQVVGSLILKRPLRLIGLRPNEGAISHPVKIWADLPTGERRPLLWLSTYLPQWRHSFWFANPLLLPAGTRISADRSIGFVLLSSLTKRGLEH